MHSAHCSVQLHPNFNRQEAKRRVVRGRVLDRDDTRATEGGPGGDPTASGKPHHHHHSHRPPRAASGPAGWASSSSSDDDGGDGGAYFEKDESARSRTGGWGGPSLGWGAEEEGGGGGGGRAEDLKLSECGDDADIERLLQARGPPSARWVDAGASNRGSRRITRRGL
jgi:hypothetical protein